MTPTASPSWPTGARTVFFDDDDNVASAQTLRRAVAERRLRRLAPRLYSSDVVSDETEIVAENLWPILGRLIPGAMIVDRSAAEDGKAIDGVLYVASDARRTTLRLPGIEVRVRPDDPLADPAEDLPWASGLRISRPARVLVDNLAPSRSRDQRASRTLSLAELEDWLAHKAIVWDKPRMHRLRDDALRLAEAMGFADRAEEIRSLFARLDGELPLGPAQGDLFEAVVRGRGWDEQRVAMFERAAVKLAEHTDPDVPEFIAAGAYNLELPFFESYFSNYIEGTVFEVAEARRIVETQQPPTSRPADGHDILGTYRCVADSVGRRAVSENPDDMLNFLRDRHASIMKGRPETGPGEWKQEPNRVGAHSFVQPNLVEGTLRRGLKLVPTVPAGFRRALYVMIVVSEVHPFTDGNGRVARVMMNAELSAVDASRIVIPTVYRNEYVGSLKRTSSTEALDVTALVRVMSFAWRWTAAMPWEDKAATEGQMTATNALNEPDDTDLGGIKLQLP